MLSSPDFSVGIDGETPTTELNYTEEVRGRQIEKLAIRAGDCEIEFGENKNRRS